MTEPKKFRREIQPKDDAGNAIGQPHVYEADSEQELFDKMADGIANGTKKIHELTKESRLGGPRPAPEGIELDAVLTPAQIRDLTPDERFTLSMQLKDPDTMQDAFDRLAEARFGRKPAEIAKLANAADSIDREIKAHNAANEFADNTPQFVHCQANSEAMLSYMTKNNMARTVKNFNIAFKELSADGLLVLKTTEATPATPAAEVTPTRTEAEVTPVPQPKAVLPGSIRRSDATASASVTPRRSPAKGGKWTSEELRKMYPELANAK